MIVDEEREQATTRSCEYQPSNKRMKEEEEDEGDEVLSVLH
jgi:hypothetical protein